MDLLEQSPRRLAGARARQGARQAGERRAFLRELLQHRGEGVDGCLGVLRPLEQDGAPEEDLEPPRRVAPPRLREVGEHGRQLLDTPLPGEDPVQGLQGLHVARLVRDDGPPRGQLGGHVVGPVPGAGREPQEVADRGPARRLGRRRVHVGEDVEPSRLLGEARDVGERLLPFPAAGGEGSPGGVEGARGIGQVDLDEGADLSLEVRPLGRVLLAGEPVLADREPRLHVLRRREHLIDERQRVPPLHAGLPGHLEDRLAHAGVIRVGGRQLREQAKRAGGVAQPEPPELGDPERHLGVEERRREALLERPGQVGRSVELHGELLHLGSGRHVVRIARQPRPRLLQPLHRVDGRRRHGQLQAGRDVGMAGQVGEDLQEPFPILGRLEGVCRPGQQPGGLLPRHEGDRAPVGRGRRDRVVQALQQEIAQLGGQGGVLRRGRLEPLAIGEQVAGLAPPLAGQRQPGQPGEGVRVRGSISADPAQLHRRLLVGAQLLLGELGGPHPQGTLLGGLPGERVGGLGEERLELGVGPGTDGQVLHPPAGLGVGGSLAQGGRRGVERAARVPEPVLADRRDVEPHARAIGRGGRLVAGDHLEHLDVPGRVPGRCVDGRQRAGDSNRLDPAREETFELPDGLGRQRRREASPLEQRQPGARRVDGARQRVEQQGCPLGLEVGPVGRALGREPRQDLAELSGGGLGAVGAEGGGEPAKRLGVGAVLGEEVPPGRLAGLRVAGFQVEPGDLQGQLATLRPGGARQAGAQVLDELGVASGARQRGLVGIRRAAVVGVEVGEHAPDPCRPLVAPEVVLLDLRHAPEQRLAGPEVASRRSRAGAEGAGELREVAGAGRQRLELPPRRHARRLGDERPGEDAHRLGGVADGLQGHLRGALQQRGPDDGVPLLRGDHLERLHELRPVARRLEEREQRPRRREESRSLPEGRLQHAPGPGLLPGGDGHLGAPEPERRVLGAERPRGEVALQDREGLGLASGVHVRLEEVQRGLVVGRVELQGAGEGLAGAVGVAEADEQDLGQPEVGRHRRGQVAGAACQPGELLAQRRPVAPLPVPALQEVQGPRVTRRGQPGPVEGLAGHRGAIGVVGHVEGRDPQPDAGGLAPIPLHGDPLLQRRGLVAPGAGRRAEPLERVRRPGRAAVEEHRLHRGLEREPVLERLVDEHVPELRVVPRQLGPVATGVAPGVEEPLGVAVSPQRLGAGHRAPARLGQLRRQAEGPAVEERGAVAPPEPVLPPPGERQVAQRPLGRARRPVGLLLQDRGDPDQVPGLLPQLRQLPQHLGLAGLEGEGALQEGLGTGEVRHLSGEGRGPPEQRGRTLRVGALPRLSLEERDRLDRLARPFVDCVARRMRAGRRAHRARGASYPSNGDPGNLAPGGSARLDAARRGC